jgi:hypothetical protein
LNTAFHRSLPVAQVSNPRNMVDTVTTTSAIFGIKSELIGVFRSDEFIILVGEGNNLCVQREFRLRIKVFFKASHLGMLNHLNSRVKKCSLHRGIDFGNSRRLPLLI